MPLQLEADGRADAVVIGWVSRQFDGGVPVPLISTPEDWRSAWRVLKSQQKGQDWHMTRSLNFTVGQPPRYWITADPRELWPRESDFVRWLADNPGLLAACLGLRGLEVTGREVVTGHQRAEADVLGRPGWRGGLRMDLTARDADDQVIVVEAQFDESDHAHLGKLVTYAREARADVAIWVIAGLDPVWGEDLEALEELNGLFAGRRRFCAVAVTLESRPGPVPGQEAPLAPRLRRVDLASGRLEGSRSDGVVHSTVATGFAMAASQREIASRRL